MTWLAAIAAVEQPRRVVLRRDGAVMPDTSREIHIDGQRFRSMAEAAREIGCSYSKVYRLIGEAWRYAK